MPTDPVTLESLAADLAAVKSAIRNLGAVVAVLVDCRGEVAHKDLELRKRLAAVADAIRPTAPPAEKPHAA